ncbi:MAG: DUF1573 domain-containing protein [Bacteroidales bacterium]|jgi:uncharacterized lipoprotein NlpE involved in copper resistance|nr:DUF1573 domain-containing protein [Bacteroidales bacterium]MCK9498945.1 DUF1573 domain-containing protein [Bacteroidales bacterium]MDY0313464.1 DUF1573 domain-containing protein [Bacteroidales bacterium]NLB86123.1 DUF1573 domain-containing protein [Bacteroidales bacterium]
MKANILILNLIIVLSLLACNNKNSKKTGGEYNIINTETADGSSNKNSLPRLEFDELEFNLGTVIQGEVVSHTFYFTNTGGGNLIISNVKASCGCTVPKWTKEPIKPNKEGSVELVFDTANREGKQIKSAKVFSNTEPNTTELTIRCEIIN